MRCVIAMYLPLPNALVCKLNSTLNSFRLTYWAFFNCCGYDEILQLYPCCSNGACYR